MKQNLFLSLVASLLAITGVCDHANAQSIIVKKRVGSNWVTPSTPDVVTINGRDVDITAPNGGRWIIYISGGDLVRPQHDIGDVNFITQNPTVIPIELQIVEESVADNPVPNTNQYSKVACRNVGDINQGQHELTLKGRIHRSANGDITCSHLVRFDAFSGYSGHIHQTTSSISSPNVILRGGGFNSVTLDKGTLQELLTAGSIVGDITVSAGNIVQMEADGDILGNVSVPNGGIFSLVSDLADIGTPLNPVQISWRGDVALLDGLTKEISGRNIYADISTTASNSQISIFETTGTTSPNGAFEGTLDVGSLVITGTDAVTRVRGDFDGSMIFRGQQNAELTFDGEMPEGTLIKIKKDFSYDLGIDNRIIIGTNNAGNELGIRGLIIINEDGDFGSTANYGWDPDLDAIIRGTFLTSVPFFDQTAEHIGAYDEPTPGVVPPRQQRGSIATVPFGVWKVSCDPPDVPVNTPIDSQDAEPAGMRFYGPITWTGTGLPVTVERRAICGSVFVDVSSQFSAAVDTTNSSFLNIWQTNGWDDGYYYRVTPKTSGSGPLLVCDVDTTPKPVVFYSASGSHADHSYYEFSTEGPCQADVNADNIVDVNDVSYVLFRLGNADCGPDMGDANLDSTVDVNDISYVLFRLGTDCSLDPAPSSMVFFQPVEEATSDINMRESGDGGARTVNPFVLRGGHAGNHSGSEHASNSLSDIPSGLEVIQSLGFADFDEFDAHIATLDEADALALSYQVYAICLELQN